MSAPHLFARLAALEEDVLYQEAASAAEPEITLVEGTLPVLITAPHGAVHLRKGEPKREDNYTVAFARLLAEETGAHALYARRRSQADPNWDRDAPFKTLLSHVIAESRIRFVLDLHGASGRHTFGLALGTLCGTSCRAERPLILRILAAHGFREGGDGLEGLDVDHHFTARGLKGQETITRFTARRLGVPAAQIEINDRLRNVANRPDATRQIRILAGEEDVRRTVAALVAVVSALAEGGNRDR